MSKAIRHQVRKIGLPAGSILPQKPSQSSPVEISRIDYSVDQCSEIPNCTLEQCLAPTKSGLTTWIHINGLQDSHLIETLGHHFKLHPLILEDIVTPCQRSKLDDYKDFLFIVMRSLYQQKERNRIEDEQCSLVIGDHFLISFTETSQGLFETVKARLRNDQSRLRKAGADFLAYVLIDYLVDRYFSTLEVIDQGLEGLEEELVNNPQANTVLKILEAKRQIAFVRKAIWPMREVISQFRRLDSPLIQPSTQIYMQDIYDHTIQAIEAVEGFRDISSEMLDLYQSNISQRLNEIIKFLTVVSTIFVPLTFITSLYGMNFENIPELHLKWGYQITLLAMAMMTVAMILYFRKKRWL